MVPMGWRSVDTYKPSAFERLASENLLFLHTVNSPETGPSIIGHLCFPARGPVVNVASKPRGGPHPEQIWP